MSQATTKTGNKCRRCGTKKSSMWHQQYSGPGIGGLVPMPIGGPLCDACKTALPRCIECGGPSDTGLRLQTTLGSHGPFCGHPCMVAYAISKGENSAGP